MFGSLTSSKIFAMDLAQFLPHTVTDWLQAHGGGRMMERARECEEITTRIAKELVREKARLPAEEKTSRDVFSLLSK